MVGEGRDIIFELKGLVLCEQGFKIITEYNQIKSNVFP